MDHRGFTDPIKGKEYYDERRETYIDSPQDLITYSAEYCYNAEEAFNLEGDNKFNKIKIAEQLAKIRISKICPNIDVGHLEYTFKDGKHVKDNISGFKWIPNKNGKIQILEHPVWSSNSKVNSDGELEKVYNSEINNLYVAGIDSIDIGSGDTSSSTRSPSDFCVVIKKRAFGLNEPLYVAIYKDRPSDIREAYKIAIRLCQYYNALINLEATRVSILSWARDHGYINMFMRRPRSASGNVTDRSNRYGTPATPVIINHQTDLIADFVNDYCHNIWFVEMLDELNRYTDSNKTKFDIIASLGMAELADEELSGTVPRQIEVHKEEFLDIGYYFDENGFRRYGIIPNKNRFATRYNYNNLLNDESANKTSDPRYR